ncbi:MULTISPECIES: HEPN domain-containing protein [Bacillus cereus group]|uniref:HEPN domain-containing protein n=1 Tax=Bacillus cereus group TaxID=86661 RepID=UPI001F5AFBCE|nr:MULTISPECIES: HEPN domain-containing protein [Bacillus cereus group]MDF9529499.1 HEPN domain-containing protein [Bacillus cereus]MDG1579053.1 HEPN domain-containing protein [Bacillus cereus]
MPDFLICRLLSDKGEIIPFPMGYGDVEIKSFSLLFKEEKLIVIESTKSFEEEVNLEIVPVISTIVNSDNLKEADYLAETKFELVLDCINAGLPISETRLLNSGFIKDLHKNWISPRLNGDSFGPFPTFKIMDRLIPKIDDAQYLFSVDNSELKLALQRSYHWLRRSQNENDLHLKCLFLWFSIECLAKVGEEDITGKVMQVLGFPLGKIGMFLSKDRITEIKKHANYVLILKKLEKQLNEIRELRNNTVHEGFRSWDISTGLLKEYHATMLLATPRIQNYAMSAVKKGLETVADFWEYFPHLYDWHLDINDFHGNILYMLQKNDNSYLYPNVVFNEY